MREIFEAAKSLTMRDFLDFAAFSFATASLVAVIFVLGSLQ